VRFGLKNKDVMRTQVRAILRAATAGRLSLVIPMVADLADVLAAKKLIKDAIDSLKTRGEAFAEVPIGAMIEVPSAVLTAEKIAGELDFFELGTNDLVQYTLAVDRGNDQVAGWFRTLHPAVLYGIKRTLEAGADAGIPVIVCGEMASTPAYAVLLAGLGATDLSMTPAMIPRVRAVLAQIETREAREIADKSLAAASADEVEEIVRNEYRTRCCFNRICYRGTATTKHEQPPLAAHKSARRQIDTRDNLRSHDCGRGFSQRVSPRVQGLG
jgi:phosphotransferase system enzyme I (PtsI)